MQKFYTYFVWENSVMYNSLHSSWTSITITIKLSCFDLIFLKLISEMVVQ